ncbi:P2X purinoceptor 3 [Liparis tanakae]|uniref:P2X purinoceptor 3 n=1 Tax=Liparis tanakae TaxID=230148 RepID=A0A4Z2F9X5_9TELE|nr:P2X purinoceptor 3 [Liparis tanakae]
MWSCIKDFFTYETTKSVVVKSWTIGIINRAVQLLIITYFIWWVFIIEKAYQVTDTGIESSVMTKVKGFGIYNNSKIMDVADYVIPTQGAPVFCIITKIITTENQVEGYCPEEFVESSRRLERAVVRGRSRVKEAVSEGAELKPMVSDSREGVAKQRRDEEEGAELEGGEWEELQEFQVYYLLVGVLVDWVLTEQSGLLLCLSEDVLLFLCVYLPTSTLFLFVSLLQAPRPGPSPPSITAAS